MEFRNSTIRPEVKDCHMLRRRADAAPSSECDSFVVSKLEFAICERRVGSACCEGLWFGPGAKCCP